MRLLVKFNLVFLLLCVGGLTGTGAASWTLLQEIAREEIAQHARLLMDTALATRAYTSTQISPLLEAQLKDTFLPQSVPAYSATEIFNDLRKQHPEYRYKEAALNPTNPRDRAVDWEADLIAQFRNEASRSELSGVRETPTGGSFYVARPIQITRAQCLTCHSTVEAAPRTLIERYGTANGFSWNLHEVIGAQIVSVPTSVPLARASSTFKAFMLSLGAVFLSFGLVLNLMLWRIVIAPVTRLSGLADRVSLGELDAPEFTTASQDEIGVLSESFTRMRKSLKQAMRMLDV